MATSVFSNAVGTGGLSASIAISLNLHLFPYLAAIRVTPSVSSLPRSFVTFSENGLPCLLLVALPRCLDATRDADFARLGPSGAVSGTPHPHAPRTAPPLAVNAAVWPGVPRPAVGSTVLSHVVCGGGLARTALLPGSAVSSSVTSPSGYFLPTRTQVPEEPARHMLCAKQKATREEPISPAGGRRAMLAEPPCAQGRRRLSTGTRDPARWGLLRISLSLSPPSVSLKK